MRVNERSNKLKIFMKFEPFYLSCVKFIQDGWVEGGMGCVGGRRIEVQLQFCLKSDNKTYAWLLN
jgi:hypothetical protein